MDLFAVHFEYRFEYRVGEYVTGSHVHVMAESEEQAWFMVEQLIEKSPATISNFKPQRVTSVHRLHLITQEMVDRIVNNA